MLFALVAALMMFFRDSFVQYKTTSAADESPYLSGKQKYQQSNNEEVVILVDQLIYYIPASSKNRLLRGCICWCCIQKQEPLTTKEYQLLQLVLKLAHESNLVECVSNDLEFVNQFQTSQQLDLAVAYSLDDDSLVNAVDLSEPLDYLETGRHNFDSNRFEHHKEISFDLKQPSWQSFWSITL